jgi:hypothetical protein
MVGDEVTPGQVIAIIALLGQIYSVDAGLLDCMIHAESDYRTDAVNGECVGLAQWHPETKAWLGEKAREDSGWMHGDIGEGDVYDLALTAWAVRNGYGDHWATFEMCGGEG